MRLQAVFRTSLFTYLILLTKLCICVAASSSSYKFHSIDVKSGLSDNFVKAVTSDQYGFMWFATSNGLNRYNGHQFIKYNISKFTGGSNAIDWVGKDNDSNIWLQSGEQYFLYDRKNDSLQESPSYFLEEKGIAPASIYLTTDDDGNLWSYSGDSIYLYNYSTDQLSTYRSPDDEIQQIVCRHGIAYALSKRGIIYNINSYTKETQQIAKIPSCNLNSRIYIDHDYNIWSYNEHAYGILTIDGKTYTNMDFAMQFNLADELITSILDDGRGSVWVGTDNSGIYIYNKQSKTIKQLTQDVTDQFSLVNMHISCLHLDSKDNIWVGYSKQGVSFTSLDNPAINIINLPNGQRDITLIAEDEIGNIWYGFDGLGLTYYDTQRDRYTDYSHPNANIITCYSKDKKNNILFGSYGSGLFQIKNNKLVQINISCSPEDNLNLKYIRNIIEDKKGNIWLSSFMSGVYQFDGISALRLPNIPNIGVSDMSYDGDKYIYVGTYNGLFRLDIDSMKVETVIGLDNSLPSLTDNHISSLLIDGKNLWIGSRNGIIVMNIDTESSTLINEKNGLSNNYIRAITKDHNGRIWVSTDNGVSSIEYGSSNEPSYYCSSYYDKDGLGNLAFNNISICTTQAGTILIGSMGGCVSIEPQSIQNIHRMLNKIYFTNLFIGEMFESSKSDLNSKKNIAHNILLSKQLDVDYQDRNFIIEVSSMDYANIHKTNYQYRINDEPWINTETNQLHFNNLLPGRYKLQARASRNGFVDSDVAEIVINIAPPIWLSNVAISVYFMLLLCIIILVISLSKRRHKRKLDEQKNKLELARLKEMDQLKTEFFMNISHDLKTPLSLIISPLEKMLPTKEEGKDKEDLELIYRNAKLLFGEVEQLLDFRKIEANKSQLRMDHGNIVDYVTETCREFYSYAKEQDITLNISSNVKTIEMDFDHKKIRRVIQNLLSNAFKYNTPKGNVDVEISTKTLANKNYVQITIADTGVGISEENKELIFDRFYQGVYNTSSTRGSGIGLSIVNNYIEMHKGYINVSDNKPQGTCFEILLPIISEYKKSITLEPQILSVENSDPENNLKVLIVEDNRDFRSFITSTISDKYQIYEASNGEEALTVLSKIDINIVITDMMMPIMDGMELCRRIKNNIEFSHVPIIMLSAQNAREKVVEGLENGADEYITKPFNPDMLCIRIEKLINRTQNNHAKFKNLEIEPSEITISNIDTELINKLISLVEENIQDPNFNVEELSVAVGMSRGHLYRKLKGITGRTPIEFIRILRVKRGKQLIEQGNYHISEVAHKVGLSPKIFSKNFREEFGYSPSKIKNIE